MNLSIKAELEKKYKDNVWENLTMGNALTQWSKKYCNNIAITDGEIDFTYIELEKASCNLSEFFLKEGFVKGDKIVVQIPNSWEFVATIFALFKVGIIPIMALPAHRKTEIEGIITNSNAKGYIVIDKYLGFDYESLVEEIRKEMDLSIKALIINKNYRINDLKDLEIYNSVKTNNEISPYDIGILLLSGGTTGTPKLIPRRHSDYLYVANKTSERCNMDEKTVYLAALPMGHNFPLCCPGILGTFSVGGRVVICRTTSPDEILPLIEEERVTITGLVPAMANMCIEFLEYDDDYDISSLKVIQIGGSVLESALAEKIEKGFDCTLQQIFGIAEGLICCTDLIDSSLIKYHTQGRPISEYDEVLIVDENGNEVLEEEFGELIVRGPYTIYGYHNLEEHNKKCITEECYFKTGDKARRLKNGNYQVVGRLTEMINRAGEKITPSEIEGILIKHEKISEVQVVGVKDSDLGEKIVVCILDDNEQLKLEDIRNYLIERNIASYKLPDQLIYMKNWPLTSVGKIDRKKIKNICDN